jgi:hypothetical protein
MRWGPHEAASICPFLGGALTPPVQRRCPSIPLAGGGKEVAAGYCSLFGAGNGLASAFSFMRIAEVFGV